MTSGHVMNYPMVHIAIGVLIQTEMKVMNNLAHLRIKCASIMKIIGKHRFGISTMILKSHQVVEKLVFLNGLLLIIFNV